MPANSVTDKQPESKAEQVARVAQMSMDDNGATWDLSDNDRRALEEVLTDRASLLGALKLMVASYDGIRDGLTSPIVIDKLAIADAAIARAEGRS